MTYRLLFLAFVFTLIGCQPLLAQQSGLAPLPADPARARNETSRNAATRPSLLSLPFFDDFAGQREGAPSVDRWETRGGALVNNRFPVAPPTKGVATLDGLDANGNAYGSASTFGITDSLTSQPIDLSGLQPGSSTYLSFFWQAGTIVSSTNDNSSSQPVFLQLDFLDNTGSWVRVWRRTSPGQANGQASAFQQRFIAVNDARYFHAGFRFRFRTSGRRATTQDAWSVDYVLLDRSRDTTNTAYRDVALGQPLNSLFERYSSLPVWQYQASANPAQELNDSIQTTLNNLDAGLAPTPVRWAGTVQPLSGGSALPLAFSPDRGAINRLTLGLPLVGSARNATLPASGTAQRFRYNIFLTTDGTPPPPRTLLNDTITRVAELANYYAFDDGSPEAVDGIAETTGPVSYRAYRLVLNRADQVTALRIYLTQPLAAGFSLTAAVWDDQNGRPGDTPKATKTFQLPSSVPAGQWLDVRFDQPVPVSGVCYFGYGQSATFQFIRFGLDLNSKVPAGFFWHKIQNIWQPFQTLRGAPMLRAVMSGVVTTTRRAAAAAAPQVYPNPSKGALQIDGRYHQARVLDALGRVVWQQPVSQAGQPTLDLGQLAPGVYLLQLTLPDATISTHRVLLEK
ncbi:T9SS type A sorting domain-containing protein [Hymenobacter koreensis]|uniref:Secretion system C-terminal sorting domain-containing protein n=1 Tax=Hymenobacter koreensis TaxID=1084523 RepID=A0ABP8IZ24_9BACT